MKIDDKDLRLTIMGCFGYSLGRRTYMPSHTVKMIKNHQKVFNTEDWKRFIKELYDCRDLGSASEKQTWEDLREFAMEKIKGEKNKK